MLKQTHPAKYVSVDIPTSTTAGTVLYTVASNRKFVGYGVAVTGNTAQVNVWQNGALVGILRISGVVPITLPPGCSLVAFASSSANCALTGVEEGV